MIYDSMNEALRKENAAIMPLPIYWKEIFEKTKALAIALEARGESGLKDKALAFEKEYLDDFVNSRPFAQSGDAWRDRFVNFCEELRIKAESL